MIRVASRSFGTVSTGGGFVFRSSANDQIVIGTGAMPVLGTANGQTIALGSSAFAAMVGGTNSGASVAIGYQAMSSTISSRADVAVGHKAGQYALYSNSNVFIGGFAGVGGHANTPYLPQLGADLSGNPVLLAGIQNIVIGEAAGIAIHGTSSANVLIGFNAGYGLGDGSNRNICIGSAAGLSIGGTPASMSANTLAVSGNVLIGGNAYQFGQGSNCVIIGPNAGIGTYMLSKVGGTLDSSGQAVVHIAAASTSGGFTYVGVDSITVGSTFYSGASEVNTTILSKTGSDAAGGTITLADNLFANLAVGTVCYIIPSPSTALFATILGFGAGASIQGGTSPTAIGSSALAALTTGSRATAVGDSAGSSATTSNDITALGFHSGQYLNGSGSTALGSLALAATVSTVITGGMHVAVGTQALRNLAGTASGHTVIGYQGLLNQTGGSDMISIGRSTGLTAVTSVGCILIGAAIDVPASSTSNFLNIGRAIFATGINGNTALVGVGTDNNAPTAPLDISGDTIRLRTSRTPASSSATGNAGDICRDDSYIYICIAANTWHRAAHATW